MALALQIGNIVCAQGMGAGTNRTWYFGIVTKITPTGKLRIQGIQSQEVQRQEIRMAPNQPPAEIRKEVRPDPNNTSNGKSYLTNANGEKKGQGWWEDLRFQVYDPNQQYYNTTDFLY